jgi:hypothetical protein
MDEPITTILEGVSLSELYTIAEAAEALGVAYITAYGFIGRKQLPWRWATPTEESQLNSDGRIGSLPGKQPGRRLKRLVDIQRARTERRGRGKRGKDKGNRIRRTKSEMAAGGC